MLANVTDIHKQSWFKTIFTTGKWYLLSSLFSKGIGLFLLPVYTRYLNPSEYGVLNSLNSVAQLLPIFISLYLDSAFARFFHEKKKDHEELKKLFSTVYWFVLGFGSIVVVISLLSSPLWMEGLLNIPICPYAYLAFIPPLFLQIGQLGIVFLRQNLESRQTTLLEVSTTAIMVATSLPLLVVFDIGVVARLIGTSCQAGFLFIYYTLYFIKKDLLRFKFNKSLLRQCLLYSIPLIPNIAGGWITGLSDRLIIAKFINLESVGLYSLASQIAALLYIIQDAITQVTGPISMSGLVHDKESTKLKIGKLSLFLWGLMLWAVLALSLFSQEIIFIFAAKDYKEASQIIWVMGFVYILSSQYRIFSDIISYHKKTWIITAAGLIMAGTSFVLNCIFVPLFGYKIAAYILVFATLLYTAWIFAWSRKLEKIYLESKKMLLLFIFFIAFILFSILFNVISLQMILIKLSIFLTYGFIFYFISKHNILIR